jgi:hypothetical protein
MRTAIRDMKDILYETKIRELINLAPKFHRNGKGELASYGVSEKTLEFICSCLKPDMVTLETGAGYSTVAFSIVGTRHTSISLKEEEGSLIRKYCSNSNIRNDFKHYFGSSEIIFINHKLPDQLDFVLIDGAHRFPYAILDWQHTSGKLKIGGVLAVDDYKMPSVKVLVDFLLVEEEWELIKSVENTIFFVKRAEAPISGDWLAQSINVKDYSWKTSSAKEAKILEEASRKNLANPFIKYWEPGHVHSPIPSIELVEKNEDEIWNHNHLPDINLNPEKQLDFLERISTFLEAVPFGDEKLDKYRYYFNNTYFPKTDACVFFCMLNELHPSKVVTIGSSFASALLLDTDEYFLNSETKSIFIESNFEGLNHLLESRDLERTKIFIESIQNVGLDFERELQSGDILFIDSSHVSKVYSDVNFILFNVLPSLRSGVIIHFHDVFYPFEYPIDWLRKGWCWNEAYLLRAFLQNNNDYEILLWNRYLTSIEYENLTDKQKTFIKPKTGGSLWLRKK